MSGKNDLFHELSIGEISLLSDLPHFNSLRAFARSRGTQLSQLSRLIKRLESSFGVALVERSSSGIILTGFGHQVCSAANEVMLEFRKFSEAGSRRPKRSKSRILSLGSQDFLNTAISANIVQVVESMKSALAVRFLDLSQDEIILAANAGALDIVLNIGELDLGRNWTTFLVDQLKWGFYCRADHPLLAHEAVEVEALQACTIITEANWDGTKVNTNESFFPPNIPFRVGGFEAETAMTALCIASASDSIAFVPELVASLSSQASVKPLKIAGIKPLSHPLYLSVEVNKVSKKLCEKILAGLQTALTGS